MKKLVGALIGLLGLTASVAAQVPTAIVEDVKGKVEGVEFMDYVAPGKVIKLGPKASIVLGYMASCWRETITGGTVVIGTDQSMVHQSDVQRIKVDCDARAQLSDREANQGAATTFRALVPGQPAAPEPVTIYALSPVMEVRGGGTLVIERTDVQGERYALPIKSDALLRGKFYDLARAKKVLTAGATYTATLGARKTTFRIAPSASADPTSLIGRLVRL